MLNRPQTERRAKQFLQREPLRCEVPVPLSPLCDRLGFALYRAALPEPLAGLILRQDHQGSIYVAGDQPRGCQCFTVARE